MVWERGYAHGLIGVRSMVGEALGPWWTTPPSVGGIGTGCSGRYCLVILMGGLVDKRHQSWNLLVNCKGLKEVCEQESPPA